MLGQFGVQGRGLVCCEDSDEGARTDCTVDGSEDAEVTFTFEDGKDGRALVEIAVD